MCVCVFIHGLAHCDGSFLLLWDFLVHLMGGEGVLNHWFKGWSGDGGWKAPCIDKKERPRTVVGDGGREGTKGPNVHMAMAFALYL